jgi:hypothetical protein
MHGENSPSIMGEPAVHANMAWRIAGSEATRVNPGRKHGHLKGE